MQDRSTAKLLKKRRSESLCASDRDDLEFGRHHELVCSSHSSLTEVQARLCEMVAQAEPSRRFQAKLLLCCWLIAEPGRGSLPPLLSLLSFYSTPCWFNLLSQTAKKDLYKARMAVLRFRVFPSTGGRTIQSEAPVATHWGSIARRRRPQ